MTNSTQDTDSTAAWFASLNASSGSATNAPTAVSMQDRFLKLLVAQMKDRDSLNPTDSAQLTSQMAQLNTVTGTSNKNSEGSADLFVFVVPAKAGTQSN